MKKYIALLLVLVMALSFAACGADKPTETPVVTPDTPAQSETPAETPAEGETVKVMTYAEYIAAPMDSQVVVECYVQGHQSWWDNKITVYAQDEDGAYFLYELACSEEDAAKLTPGTGIRVTGYKGEWAGEVEIMDATFEFIDGSFVATPVDATAWLGTDELIAHQNELVSFTGMTVEGIEYKNGEPGDDIYVTLGYGGASYSFCVEVYLTGPETDVYTTVGTLAVGDVVDVQGFLYWYEGPNAHITSITKTASAPTVMSYAEYIAADLDTKVVVECYVQGHQSWWDNKITVYAQDEDGAYFLYELACSEEDAAKLTPGTGIRVTGYKGEWAGEVEIMDATFEFIDGSFVATPVDATAWLGTDELIAHQNELVSFTGMTVEGIEYKNGEPGDDIYVTLGYGGASYSFCVEVYLTGPETDVYTTVGTLAVGDVVDVQGFLYWYEGPNAHITSIAKVG